MEITKQRDHIVKNLDADFQRTGIGRNSTGKAVDQMDTTYSMIVRRMIEVTYGKHESRSIDPSWKRITRNLVPKSLEALYFG